MRNVTAGVEPHQLAGAECARVEVDRRGGVPAPGAAASARLLRTPDGSLRWFCSLIAAILSRSAFNLRPEFGPRRRRQRAVRGHPYCGSGIDAPDMRARRFCSARTCSCFTAPSLLVQPAATSRMLFLSMYRPTITARWSGGKSSTSRKTIARSLDCREIGLRGGRRQIARVDGLARRALRAIDDRVGGDAQQPGGKRRAAPLESAEVGQRLVKHLRRDVFRRIAIADAYTT